MTNKEPKYTSAPWVQNGMNGIHTQSGSPIAITDGENRLANAKLISAAPELLSVAQKLISLKPLIMYVGDAVPEYHIGESQALNSLFIAAEQAIQKALTL